MSRSKEESNFGMSQASEQTESSQSEDSDSHIAVGEVPIEAQNSACPINREGEIVGTDDTVAKLGDSIGGMSLNERTRVADKEQGPVNTMNPSGSSGPLSPAKEKQDENDNSISHNLAEDETQPKTPIKADLKEGNTKKGSEESTKGTRSLRSPLSKISKNLFSGDIKDTEALHEGKDPYTEKPRQHSKGLKEGQMDHIIEIQMLDFAWALAIAPFTGQVNDENVFQRIQEVVNSPEININFTSQSLNLKKKGPITAWLNCYRDYLEKKYVHVPCLRCVARINQSELSKDATLDRILSAMKNAFIKIKEKLESISHGMLPLERAIIIAFLHELEKMIEKMQIH